MKQQINLDYPQTLDFLYRQLPMFQRVGAAAMKKDLGNILALVKHLGKPQRAYPCIHIAGTNGKGSTAHLLSAVLQSAGYRVGLYTSPHYKDFRERIKVNGKLAKKAFVVDFVAQYRSFFTQVQPSFFEITVAMAFEYFQQEQVDIAIIETGLGGRLDSTNIITPDLSIITNISFDHQQFLGDTLPAIAGEKAGIIKTEIPVIIGERQEEVAAVFTKKAKEMQAPLSFANEQYQVEEVSTDFDYTYFKAKRGEEVVFENIPVNLHGAYQAKNLVTVLTAVDQLRKSWTITDAQMMKGFKNLKKRTYYLGRWQKLQEKPLVLCDSAHNEAGLQIVLQQLALLPKSELHIVLGMVNDKDLGKVLRFFPKEARYYFSKANIPRGLPAEELRNQAKHFDLKGRTYSSIRNALLAAKRKASAEDVIFVGGSIFTVAEVL